MKKLVLLLLVVWALPHASRRNMLPDWIPIPSALPQAEPQASQSGLDPESGDRRAREPLPPPPVKAPIMNSKWMDQERKRVEQMNLAVPCRAASEATWIARTAGNSRGAVAVRQGRKVLSESERLALLADSEKFFNENCRR